MTPIPTRTSRRRGFTLSKWVLGVVVVGFVAIALFYGVFAYFRPSVEASPVVQGPVVEAFYATGTVSPEREFDVRSSVDGIVKLLVDKGAVVHKGDQLALVDNGQLRFAVEQQTAELHRQEALADDATSPVLAEIRGKLAASTDMLKIALKDEQRVTGLIDRGATSQTDLDQSIDRVKSLESDVESYKAQIASRKIDLQRDVAVAKAALVNAQWSLDQAIVRSPIDGTVLDWPMSSGTRVAANDHVLQLADVTPANLVMRAQVDEEDKNKLRPPTADDPQIVKMSLYAYPDEVLTGHVTRIYDKADPDRRTYEVDVRFDRPDLRLAAGMTGELNFIVAQRQNALIIPSQALQTGSVFVVNGDVISRPDIVVGIKSLERVEILSGLQAGDLVIISPTLDLSPGQHVRVHQVTPQVATDVGTPTAPADSFKGFH